MEALILLQYALQNSPHNRQFELLRLAVLQRVHAPASAATLFSKLEVQHMQLDTMAHYLLPGLYEVSLYKVALQTEAKLIEFHKRARSEIPGTPNKFCLASSLLSSHAHSHLHFLTQRKLRWLGNQALLQSVSSLKLF